MPPKLQTLRTRRLPAAALVAAAIGIVSTCVPGVAREKRSALLDECLHAKDPDERVEACTAAIDEAHDRATLARALNARGNALCASPGRCADAVPNFAGVVRLYPSVGGYFDNYARALRAAGRHEDAIAASDRAIQLAPRAAFVYAGKAASQEVAGNIPGALATIERAIALLPDDAWLWEIKGSNLGRQKRYAEAYAAFAHALELQPHRASVLVRRADVEIMERDHDAAEKDLETYPSDGDEAPHVRDKLSSLRAARQSSAASKVEAPREPSRSDAPSATADAKNGAPGDSGGQSQGAPPSSLGTPAAPASTTSEIDACDAPGVLSAVRRLSEQALKSHVFELLYLNVQEAHFEYVGIRQVSFDAENEHRFCAMDRQLVMTFYPHVHRDPARSAAPVEYQIDRRLDGDRGSYVTCDCGKGL